MNYVKSCLIITMLQVVGYSQCNESNWEDYYPKLAGCALSEAFLFETNLTGAIFCNLNASPSGDVCEKSITDENEDGYDDVSYDAGAESGDLNLYGANDVLDAVMLIDIILNP